MKKSSMRRERTASGHIDSAESFGRYDDREARV